jgi:hypothetical protein
MWFQLSTTDPLEDPSECFNGPLNCVFLAAFRELYFEKVTSPTSGGR